MTSGLSLTLISTQDCVWSRKQDSYAMRNVWSLSAFSRIQIASMTFDQRMLNYEVEVSLLSSQF